MVELKFAVDTLVAVRLPLKLKVPVLTFENTPLAIVALEALTLPADIVVAFSVPVDKLVNIIFVPVAPVNDTLLIVARDAERFVEVICVARSVPVVKPTDNPSVAPVALVKTAFADVKFVVEMFVDVTCVATMPAAVTLPEKTALPPVALTNSTLLIVLVAA